MIHSRIRAHPDRRRCGSVGRPPSRKLEIEALEDRVVPATITVTNLGDTGPGTLRAAIEQANLDQSNGTINFAPSVMGTITLSTALPELSSNVIIAGPGLSALSVTRDVTGPAFNIFTVAAGVSVSVSGLTISGGLGATFVPYVISEGSAGGIYNAGTLALTDCTLSNNSAISGGVGGAIYNTGTLTLTDCTLSDNLAFLGGGIYNSGTTTVTGSTLSGDSGAPDGGGIFNTGTLTLTDSTLSGNSAISGGGGIGAGIDNYGTAILTDCTFSDNTDTIGNGGIGAGMSNFGMATLTDCTFSNNSAGDGGSGAGIFNTGTLTLSDSTLSGNSAISDGGGVYNSGMATLTDCTFSANTAVSGFGGGVYNSGMATLTDCTLSANTASSGGGVDIQVVNVGLAAPKVTAIANIFANVTGGNLVVGPGTAFVSLGLNLFSDTPAAPLNRTDLINTNPLLGPLADNGGPTMTMALLPGSPAINAGVSVPGVTTDQRGVFRPQGRAPDIGGQFELQLPPEVLDVRRNGVHDQPPSFVVTFTRPMDAASAEDLADYQLVSAGPDPRFGHRDVRAIRIRSVRYDASSNTVTIRPAHRLPLRHRYWLTILGTPPGGLVDTTGLFLDGAGTGQQGSNYVTVITDKLLAHSVYPQRRQASLKSVATSTGTTAKRSRPWCRGISSGTGATSRRALPPSPPASPPATAWPGLETRTSTPHSATSPRLTPRPRPPVLRHAVHSRRLAEGSHRPVPCR